MARYESITLEKGMYDANGCGLTKTLESLDPSENYKGTPLEGLDAYERQLKRFGIRVGGAGSDRVEKFFQTSNAAVLFPEYISRTVLRGMEMNNVLDDIVAAKTHIDSLDYRTISLVSGAAEMELKPVNEGAAIPETTIDVHSNLVHLNKRGRMLVASYESIRFQRLDVFGVMLRQIGRHISTQLLEDAIAVIKNGDGNDNEAMTYVVETEGTLTYGDLVNLWVNFAPYDLTTIMASTDMVYMMLNMSEMKDSFAGHNFHKTGELITPLGAKLIHVPYMDGGTLAAVDKHNTLEMVVAADVTTEYDKLIDRQLNRAAISTICGFSKLVEESSAVMSLG